MSKRTLLILSFALVLLLAPAGVASASTPNAPTAAPCGPDTAYDPACDVNHDGVINVVDVQLTADKWNQSGTWFGDNDHDHLGQTWTGNDDPLRIESSFATSGENAPLVLSNSAAGGLGLRIEAAGGDGLRVVDASDDGLDIANAGGDGVRIGSAGKAGVRVVSATNTGVYVDLAGDSGLNVNPAGGDGVRIGSAGRDGVRVNTAGSPSASPSPPDGTLNGVVVRGAEHYGLYVGRADSSGVWVNSAGSYGVFVSSAGDDGVWVNSAGKDGVYVYLAGWDGVRVNSAGYDGFAVGCAGNVTTCTTDVENANGFEVANAEDYGTKVVYAGRAAFRSDGSGTNAFYAYDAGDSGVWIRDAANWAGYFTGNINVTGNCSGCRIAQFAVNSGGVPLAQGDIVALMATSASPFTKDNVLFQVKTASAGEPLIGVVAGKAEIHTSQEDGTTTLVPRDGVVAQPGDYVSIIIYGPVQVKAGGAIALGERLTVKDTGGVRALQSVDVQGVKLAESASTLGMSLVTTKPEQETVWVLVNPH